MTLALVAVTLPPAPRASAPQVSGAVAHPAPDDGLRRCRTITTADPDCVAVWEAKRRRVFGERRKEEHTSELQSLMRTSYAVFCLKKNSTHYSAYNIKINSVTSL